MKKYNETMIIRNGKLLYAISLNDKAQNTKSGNFIYIYNGEVYFSENIFSATNAIN